MKKFFTIASAAIVSLIAACTYHPAYAQPVNPSKPATGVPVAGTGINVAGQTVSVIYGTTAGTALQGNASIGVANGGTGLANPAAFAIPITNGTSAYATAPAGAASTVLMSNGAAANPSFQSLASIFASPSPIGSTAANTGAFTDLSASGTVSGAGFAAYEANINHVQTLLNVAALRAINCVPGLLYQTQGYYAVGDAGSGVYVCNGSDTTSPDNGGTIIAAANANRFYLRYSGQISVRQFGAKGDGSNDDTAPIQNTINWASNNGFAAVYAPKGVYNFTRLYFFYDAALNPGFNTTKPGRLIIKGDGQLTHGDAENYPAQGNNGTVFVGTQTTGDAVILSPASADGGSYSPRQFHLEDLTVIANTTGFVVRNSAGPQSRMVRVTVVQQNVAGSGIYWHSSWFTHWSDVWVTNTNTTLMTGVGVDFGSSLFAGMYVFDNCVFERFDIGFQANGSSGSSGLTFSYTTFQSNISDGFQVTQGYRGIVFNDSYWEFNGRNHINVTSTATNTNLNVNRGFMLGGSASATSMSGPMINIKSTVSYTVDGLNVFRPWTNIINVAYYAANGSGGAVRNVTVDSSDNSPASPIYLYGVDDQRAFPTASSNMLYGSSNVREYNTATWYPSAQTGAGVETYKWNQPVYKTSVGLNGTVVLQSATTPPLVIITTTGPGAFVSLPGSPGQGRYIVIANQVSSSNSILVRQSDQVTNLLTLNAGQSALCYYEPASAKWVAIGPLAFVGL